MRKLLLGYLLVLLAILPGVAQRTIRAAAPGPVEPPAAVEYSPWKQRVDSLFEYVDHSAVSTGFLSDYGFSFLNPDNYTGAALLDSNYVDINSWRMLYAAMQTSIFNGNTTLPSLRQANLAPAGYSSTRLPGPTGCISCICCAAVRC